MTPNLRELLTACGEYHTYNREERYYAALLFHFLLKKTELKKFLDKFFPELINKDFDLENVKVFFEYAHVRDLWAAAKSFTATNDSTLSNLDSLNNKLKYVIIKLLNPPEMEPNLNELTTIKFNDFFGAKSKTKIQMPGRWSKSKISEWANENGHESKEYQEFAQRVCTLIWAFNAKADIVIHIDDRTAICIEAKVISPESLYQADLKEVFSKSQTAIQKFILKELLGFETTFTILSKKKTQAPDYLNWIDVFELMDKSNEFAFVKDSMQSNVIS